ncbi:flavodoxin FldA [Synechococcus sp. CC9616]|uniref:flavodoxin FldA n=1 Tax=Synechococcus sp. CC9616 TaxID=110663 RepID=UPI00048D1762|nr:flavodoxin FldA [Synechococcus sp. CC9616]
MKFTIVYSTATGNTENIAERLQQLIPSSELKDLDYVGQTSDLTAAEALVCCIPTWNTGAPEKRSGTSWDQHLDNIRGLDFSNTVVAIVGLGDSAAFSKYFCDAMEELYTAFLNTGATIIGKVPAEDYIFDHSKSNIDGLFCGLPIDEDNESEKTERRLSQWVAQITSQV